MPLTAEEVKNAVLANGIKFIMHHKCGVCQDFVGFVIRDGTPFFDSSCDCASSGMRPYTWEYVTEFIDTTDDETRSRLKKLIGITSS